MTAYAHIDDGGDLRVRNALGVQIVHDPETPAARLRVWDGQPNIPVRPLNTRPDDFGVREGRDVTAHDVLYLHRDEARALYEALGEHFGHIGNTGQLLRRDYDAERARVDRLIGALMAGTGVTEQRRPGTGR